MAISKSEPLTVVITGVTRGLGRAMVDEFIRLGHTVCGCARTKSQIAKLQFIYPAHDFQKVDVALNSEVAAWARRLASKHQHPYILLNNAAIINNKGPLYSADSRSFSREIDINIKGVFHVIRHFAPMMIKQRRGVIVNFTSRWGRHFEKEIASYCATKWAVTALTAALAEELKPMQVAAIGLNPGVVKTAMLKKYLGSNAAFAAADYLSPSEWAKIAVPFILRLGFKDTGKIRKVRI
ncbi:MAG TPA: SDR family oxidoreductase [Verrucomicrobiae bacterium]|jgi:NAD(P)-dependent dehydrogenase (short-subunit alcohol dehydrogenase family)|nr:SDR family oxidoreductase [Verrucomicrobiae bacterium]